MTEKRCRYCGAILHKRDNEDNWAFSRRVFCNSSCSAKKSSLDGSHRGLKYKKRSDAGVKRPFRGSFETRLRLSKNSKRLWGDPNYRTRLSLAHTGKKQSEETIAKRVQYLIGENNHNWKGGVTPLNEKVRKSRRYKAWRKKVFERDNYTCVWCGAHNGNGKTVKLNADHLRPFSLYPALRFAINNGRTLCQDCHRTTVTYGSARRRVCEYEKKNHLGRV